MDNLTHSLAGAVLGQMGLKKKTGLGMATLIIAANIPDIDAIAVLMGGHQHLAIRRGITHGPIAMVVLPLVLTAIMIWFDCWQIKRGKRPADRLPIHRGWLLALAYIGTLSHPALDWLNSYGIRLLEPFSSKWFYGDSIFIIDIWIWIALIAGVWISRRRENKGGVDWRRPAWVSFTAVCVYIFVNGMITERAEAAGGELVEMAYDFQPSDVVANPVPIKFWERQLLWRYSPNDQPGIAYGDGYFSILKGAELYQNPKHSHFSPETLTLNDLANAEHDKIRINYLYDIEHVYDAAKSNDNLKSYLFWSRMPIMEKSGEEISITDQRFTDPRVGDRFTVKIPYPKDRLEPTGK